MLTTPDNLLFLHLLVDDLQDKLLQLHMAVISSLLQDQFTGAIYFKAAMLLRSTCVLQRAFLSCFICFIIFKAKKFILL